MHCLEFVRKMQTEDTESREKYTENMRWKVAMPTRKNKESFMEEMVHNLQRM
jgi:hypothetical protein